MPTRAAHASVFHILLGRPGRAFFATLSRAIDAGELPFEVVKRLTQFSERVADLSLEEMQELHDETFGPADHAKEPGPPTAERPGFLDFPSREAIGAVKGRIAALLSDWARTPTGTGPVASELRELTERVDAALTAARNPYSYVFAGLAVLLRDGDC